MTARSPSASSGAPAGAAPGPARPAGGLGMGLFRSPDRRVLGGVAGGLGERLGLDPVLVRLGFVLLALNGAAGALVYLVLWAVLPEGTGREAVREPGARRAAGAGLMLAGTMILLREAGLWLGDALAWSVGLAALGAAVIWARADSDERERLRGLAGRLPEGPLDVIGAGRAGRLRLALGIALFAGGVATFLWRTSAFNTAPAIVVTVAITVTGLGILAGPWGWRLARQLAEERRERIRQEERAEMAAHLHDSVLQTLALIQRTDRAPEMVALARNQERELRAWLNGAPLRRDDSVAGAIEEAAAAVELQFKVPVEVVTVGDAPLDERLAAIVEAGREATVNAAKHSGAGHVSVYLEVEPDAVTAYVRDDGAGFDLDGVATDRRGIAESIIGRMERSGGSASVQSEPGEGTEVHLTLPRAAR